MTNAAVELQDISKSYGGFVALDRMSLAIGEGRICCSARAFWQRQDDAAVDYRRLLRAFNRPDHIGGTDVTTCRQPIGRR